MPTKILILSANAKTTTPLRLGEEVRKIKEALKLSRRRDEFHVIECSAVRPDDLRRALLEHEPEIVHFSGHGEGSEGLCLENDDGEVKLVSSQALARLFKLFDGRIQCILLNACYSVEQAEQLRAYADYVIGMKAAVGDAAALRFSAGFYDALGAGRGYADAFEFGRAAIDLEGILEADVPVMLTRGQSNSAVQIFDPAETNRKVEEERQVREEQLRRTAEEAERKAREEERLAREEQERRARADWARILTPQNIHGWSTDRVQALQQEIAHALGMPVAFRDKLKNGGQGPEMLVIPPGTFLMGSPSDEPDRDLNEIQHQVTLSRPFAIGRYAVTFDEYDAFCAATGREKPKDQGQGRGDHPVINVSWQDAAACCEWLSQQTDRSYRLPTEAEWEYSCRAGTVTPFWWGKALPAVLTTYVGNYPHSGGAKGESLHKTLPVKCFEPNPWGLYQVHGNVWEWCWDRYGDYLAVPITDPKGPPGGYRRVVRGGRWGDDGSHFRSARRGAIGLDHRPGAVGFRFARDLTSR